MTSGPRRPCRALRQQRLYHWGKRAGGVVRHATLKAGPVRKTGWRCSASRDPQGGIGEKDGLAASASRDPQGGAGEKDILETVVTRHELH